MSSPDYLDASQAGTLTDNAMAELQLRQQPFTSAPTDGEWFGDDTSSAQLHDIKHALISGDDLLLVLGPEGSGKSSLLAQLGASSGQRIQCFSVKGSSRFSSFNLFAGMLEAFKRTPPDDLKLMLDELVPCLQSMMNQNTLGAIVLDDADQIPEHELTKLLSAMLYVNSGDDTLLRVTLAGPEELEGKIPEVLPEGADLPYSTLQMEPFDHDRARAYLEYRLNKAGSFEEFPLSEKEVAQINEAAGGYPGALHGEAARLINMRDEDYLPELPPELATRQGGRFGGFKMVLGGLALLMIVGGLLLSRPDKQEPDPDKYTVVEKRKIGEKDTQTLRLIEEDKVVAATADDTANSATAAGADATGSASATADDTASQPGDTSEQAAAQAAEQQAAADKAAAEKAAREAEEKAAAAQAAAAQAAEEKAAAEQKRAAEEAAKVAAEKAAAEKAAAEKAAAEQAATQSKLANLESPNWVLVQDEKLYTVQMSASTDRASVENFLANNKLPAPNSIFSFDRNGTTWYALVHGLYPSIEEARKDIEKLPASARSNQPWIRAIGRIQNALKEQNQ